MNIYSYFPTGVHDSIFEAIPANRPLVISGMGNITAKSYLVSDYAEKKKFKNVFWLVNDNKAIYEVKNNLPFWTKRASIALDHLLEGNREDYRITEVVIGLHDKESRVYLLNYKDVDLVIPTYEELVQQGVVIKKDQEMRAVEFFNQLIQLGYQLGSDVTLNKGEYRRSGGVLNVFPPDSDYPIKIELDYEKISGIWKYDQEKKQLGEELKKADFLPVNVTTGDTKLLDQMTEDDLLVIDDVDEQEDAFLEKLANSKAQRLFLRLSHEMMRSIFTCGIFRC